MHSLPILKNALLYFALVFGVGFVLGPLRILFVVPRIGVRAAELLETPIMVCAIWLVANWLHRRELARFTPAARFATGFLSLAIVLAAEFGVGYWLRGLSVRQMILERDPISGPVYYLSLLFMALLPWLLGFRRKLRPQDQPAN